MQIHGQQFWNSWYVISVLEKDICQCKTSVQSRGKSPKETSESTCKPPKVHKARRKLSQDQLHTVTDCPVGEGVSFLKAYIQVSCSRWSRSLWEKPQGTLVQHLMSLSALPDTVPLPFSPEYEPSFPVTEMLCTTLQVLPIFTENPANEGNGTGAAPSSSLPTSSLAHLLCAVIFTGMSVSNGLGW